MWSEEKALPQVQPLRLAIRHPRARKASRIASDAGSFEFFCLHDKLHKGAWQSSQNRALTQCSKRLVGLWSLMVYSIQHGEHDDIWQHHSCNFIALQFVPIGNYTLKLDRSKMSPQSWAQRSRGATVVDAALLA